MSEPAEHQHADGALARAAAAEIETLYRQHGRGVWRLCSALLRDRAEVDDAFQQVFLSAYQALLNGGGPRHPAAWLATIARNECRRRRQPPARDVDGEAFDIAADPPADVLRRLEVDAVWRAIAELPSAQRQALLLREIKGLSYEQVAASLDVSHSSVRSLLTRARERIQLRVRAGSAAIGGISWLDALVRLLASGPAPGLTVATRAAAVGLGAATLGGSPLVHFDRGAPAPVRAPAQATVVQRTVPAARPVVFVPAAPVRHDHTVVRRAVEPRRHEHDAVAVAADSPPAVSEDRSLDDVTTATATTTTTASDGGGDGSSTTAQPVQSDATSSGDGGGDGGSGGDSVSGTTG